MKITRAVLLLAAMLTRSEGFADAQEAARVFRIGFLISPNASFISFRVAAFRQRLRELGYVEGKNIVIEYRYAEGRLDRLPYLAAELVGLKVDVIVTVGPANRAAMKATSTIPIITTGSSDPIGDGLVSSLARPGGNITGNSLMFPELDGKRLELLHEAFPKIARVAFLGDRVTRGKTLLSKTWSRWPMLCASNFYRSRYEPLTILRALLHGRNG